MLEFWDVVVTGAVMCEIRADDHDRLVVQDGGDGLGGAEEGVPIHVVRQNLLQEGYLVLVRVFLGFLGLVVGPNVARSLEFFDGVLVQGIGAQGRLVIFSVQDNAVETRVMARRQEHHALDVRAGLPQGAVGIGRRLPAVLKARVRRDDGARPGLVVRVGFRQKIVHHFPQYDRVRGVKGASLGRFPRHVLGGAVQRKRKHGDDEANFF